MNDWKGDCKINGSLDGQVHLVGQRYDARFMAWYGAVHVDCSTVPDPAALAGSLVDHLGGLVLADGRRLPVYFCGSRVQTTFPPEPGEGPGDLLLYFVALGDVLDALEAEQLRALLPALDQGTP